MLGVDDVGCHSFEGFRGKDGDLLRLPIVCVEPECPACSASCLEASEMVEVQAAKGREAGDVGATAVAEEALLALSPMVSLVVSPVLAPPVVSYKGECIALSVVERSTRCVTHLLFLF
jgi:hypothetical protein